MYVFCFVFLSIKCFVSYAHKLSYEVCARYQEENEWHTLYTSQTIYDKLIQYVREDEICSATYWQACPDVAIACHTLFFSQDSKEKLLASKPMKTRNIIECNERFSINFLGGTGKICRPYFSDFIRSQDEFFKEHNGEERADADEPYLSYEHLVENNKCNFICMDFFVSHFAFGKQRDRHMVFGPTDVEEAYIDDDYRFVERYQALALKVHKNCGLSEGDRRPLHVLIQETNKEDERWLRREYEDVKRQKRNLINTGSSVIQPKKSHKKAKTNQPAPSISPIKMDGKCLLLANSSSSGNGRGNRIVSSNNGKHFVVRNKKPKFSVGNKAFVNYDIVGYKPGTTFYPALVTKCKYNRKSNSFKYDISWVEDNTYGTNIDECKMMRPGEYKQYVTSQSTWKHRNGNKAANPVHLIEDTESDIDLHDDFCSLCGNGGKLLCCDTCTLAYHMKCVRVGKYPTKLWSCPTCVKESC